MTLCSLREVLDQARAGGYGVGAFNVTDIEQVEAVLDAAAATNSPVIVQTIAGASAFASDELYWDLLLRTVDHYPQIPIVVHLDHGPDAQTCKRAIDAGFSSVMIDGSLDPVTHQPTSFDANVAVTQEVVAYARARGVSVEAELGTIGGSKDGATHAEIVLADPEEARRFVEAPDVDALAVPATFEGAGEAEGPIAGPSLSTWTAELPAGRDLFLDISGWGKGMVWVNGVNLGRFWSKGPTATMYVPGQIVTGERATIVPHDPLPAPERAVRFLAAPSQRHSDV